ncbi:amidase [Lichenifustis flavocetrariae]|uniref:Indoleacetamide hydrolase n=1 Tax=Lichenifustis flavocetrariae TaxID=2949735 RepID=A0AA41ZB76_9HYPH|nr:amidase [Lichenifustis flavocetrariae]MCW6512687.1 amidase [Lichenifustis flavocetrariae]
MTTDWNDEGGLQLAAAIREGRTSAAEALAAALERAEDLAHLGAVRVLAADPATAEAERIDRDRARGASGQGAFLGVPFLVKDLGTRVKGLPTVWGSRVMLRRSRPAPADDDLVARFRAAGLVIFGMTTVPEFGMTFTSEPLIGPAARNPLDERLTPGGSSGGAAAAVAAGIVAVAHANDAAGSIRVPAACCGLVGLKPSRGATPHGPDFNNYNSGIVGNFVVARTLDDAAAVLDGLAGNSRGPHPDPAIGPACSSLGQPVAALRVGVVQDLPAGLPFDDSRRDAVIRSADVLRRAGHTLVPVEPGALTAIIELSGLAAGRVLSANLARMLGELEPPLRFDDIEPLTRAALTFGQSLSGCDLVEAEMAIGKVGWLMANLFENVDVLLTPMLSGPPPAIGAYPTDHTDLDHHGRRGFALAPFAGFANVAGTPALTVPHGRDSMGLPLPIQLIGPMGSDVLLLRLACSLRAVEPWSFQSRVAGLD